MSRVAVIGAGAWGTGLAIVLARKGRQAAPHNVCLWANEPQVSESIGRSRIDERFLPGFVLPDSITATSNLNRALDGAEIVVSVMPSAALSSALPTDGAPAAARKRSSSSCAKGLEDGTLLRMTESDYRTSCATANSPLAWRPSSGPSFAKEVARGDPTAVTVTSIETAT